MFENLFERSGLSLDRLRSFCEIAGAGGISKAAVGDPARQSQLSRQIKELEEFFGAELTMRRGRNIVLTNEGERLAVIGREILGSLDDFLTERRGSQATLTIGGGESFLQWLLIPRLKDVQKEMPGVLISMRNLRSGEIVRQVQNAELDMGIVRDDLVPPSLGQSTLGVVRYALFISEPYGTKMRKIGWKDALRRPLVGIEGEGQLMTAFREAAEKSGIGFSPCVLCSSMTAALSALKDLNGVAVLPEIATSELTTIDAPFLRAFDRRMVVIWNKRQALIRSVVEVGHRKLPRLLKW